ncbi:DUF998 domain-containing protein [Clostridium ganghwense]|uniref:DUF998 domain-containing protein n=1 Tax=Clostridium ganghwense TaxID=312089 RepID=A0ABT4CNV4_9CLOT|nr:DUF998 domain-containing protein [Clostridium ganghwense]MCY6370707.1 DUF998 domain-containing protein [Clostridium ganghwense]
MENNKIKSFWKIGTISGMMSSIVYVLHVFIGGILWDGYNSIKQPISDLTGIDAPNARLLRGFTSVYGILAIIFAISLYVILRNCVNKISKFEMILLIIMEVSSFVGYSLFPLEGTNTGMTFQNKMHIIVTVIVVITTIGCTFFIGIGFSKIKSMKKLGLFVIGCGVIITISGVSTGIVMAKNIPILGLIERINIFTLQLMIFVLSFSLVKQNN